MAGVLLTHCYYLADWSVSRFTYTEREGLYGPEHTRNGYDTVALVVTNPHPVDASFRVEIFGANGIELTRPQGPGGSGLFDADFGFPASATLAPRNQIRLFLDTTSSNVEYRAFGWARIWSSLPLVLAAQAYNQWGRAGDYIPIVSADALLGLPAQLPGTPPGSTPRPPDPAGVEPPAFDAPPPMVDPKLYDKLDALLARAHVAEANAKSTAATATATILELDPRAITEAVKSRRSFWSRLGWGDTK